MNSSDKGREGKKKKIEHYSLKKVREDEWGYEDQDGCHWDSVSSWFWGGVLGGCGCGSSEELGEMAVKLLKHFATPHMERKLDLYDSEAYEILAHWMSEKDLIEHGTSVGGSWLTEKGEEVYEAVNNFLDIKER